MLVVQHEEVAVDGDGWLATGDIATVDGEGYFHITGRIKDVIKSGGEWIVPSAIETPVLLHDKVNLLAQCCCMTRSTFWPSAVAWHSPDSGVLLMFALLWDRLARRWLTEPVICFC